MNNWLLLKKITARLVSAILLFNPLSLVWASDTEDNSKNSSLRGNNTSASIHADEQESCSSQPQILLIQAPHTIYYSDRDFAPHIHEGNWEQQVKTFVKVMRGESGHIQGREDEARIPHLRENLGLDMEADDYLDKFEEMFLESIIKDINQLQIFLNFEKPNFCPTSIQMIQDSLIIQLHRLARFRLDQSLHYYSLFEAVSTGKVLAEGPLNTILNWNEIHNTGEEVTKKKVNLINHILSNYNLEKVRYINYILTEFSDFISHPLKPFKLREMIENYLCEDYWFQLENLYHQKDASHSTFIDLDKPYLTVALKLHQKPLYFAPLKKLILSNLLATQLTPGSASSHAQKLDEILNDFKKILLFHKINEYACELLYPIKALVDSHIGDGERELSSDEINYALNRIYLFSTSIVEGHVPKIYLQADETTQPKSDLEFLYRLIPFKSLRNIGLLSHHATYLERPQDLEILTNHLPHIKKSLKILLPLFDDLIKAEMGKLEENSYLKSNFDATKKKLDSDLEMLHTIGNYGLDVSTLYKVSNCVDEATLENLNKTSCESWSIDCKASFIRILGILGESEKKLSSRAKDALVREPSVIWQSLGNLRDKVIIHGSKSNFEEFLNHQENNELVKKVLDEIKAIRSRAALILKSPFTLKEIPSWPPLEKSLEGNLSTLLKSVKGSSEKKTSNKSRAPKQKPENQKLQETFDRNKSLLERNRDNLKNAILSIKKLYESNQLSEGLREIENNFIGIRALPFTRIEEGKISLFFGQLSGIRAAVDLIKKAFENREIDEDQFQKLSIFFTSKGPLDEKFIKEIECMVGDLGFSEAENERDDDEEINSFMVSAEEHPLVQEVSNFILEGKDSSNARITRSMDCQKKLQEALEIIENLNLDKRFEALINITFFDESKHADKINTDNSESTSQEIFGQEKKENVQIEKYLKEATRANDIKKSKEGEEKSLDILRKRLEPYGITEAEHLNIWLQELKKFYGLSLQPKDIISKHLSRAKKVCKVLLKKFNEIEPLVGEIRKYTEKEIVEKFFANKSLCLAIEDSYETLRHHVKYIEDAIRYVRVGNPSIAALIEQKVKDFIFLGTYLGHILDTTSFETRTDKGRDYELSKTLNTIFNFKADEGLSFSDALSLFSDYCEECLKNLASSREVVRPTLLSSQPLIAQDNNGTRISFNVISINPDGNCGFNALGIPRYQAIHQLLRDADRPEIREAVSDDIRQALVSNQLPASLRNLETGALSRKYFDLQASIDKSCRNLEIDRNSSDLKEQIDKRLKNEVNLNIINELNNLSFLLEDQEGLENKIQEFACNKDNYNKFILSEFGRGAWLSYIRGARGTLYALAHINNLNVHIWTHNRAGFLEQIPLAPGLESGRRVDLLHTNRLTHFDRLSLLPAEEDRSTRRSNEDSVIKQPRSLPLQDFYWSDIRLKIYEHSQGLAFGLFHYSSPDVKVEKLNDGFKVSCRGQFVIIKFGIHESDGQQYYIKDFTKKNFLDPSFIKHKEGFVFFFNPN